MPETLLPWFGYQVILVSEVMNVPMRLQKQPSAQQSQLWSAPASDFNPELTKHYREVWQAEWDGCFSNKLNSVKPHLGYCSVTHLSRRDAVILRRLCIGHTCVTHRHLLTSDSQPLCDECKCSGTVKHILLHCVSKKGPTLKRYSSKLYGSILMIFGRNIQKSLE